MMAATAVEAGSGGCWGLLDKEILLPTPTNVNIIHLPGSDLVQFVSIQQWMQEQLGVSVDLLHGSFVLVPSAALNSTQQAAHADMAIPWRLRQVSAVEWSPAGSDPSAATVVLVGGDRVAAGSISPLDLQDAPDYQYLCCELAALQNVRLMRPLRVFDVAHVTWRMKTCVELEAAHADYTQEQAELSAAGYDAEVLHQAGQGTLDLVRSILRRLPPLDWVSTQILQPPHGIELNPQAAPTATANQLLSAGQYNQLVQAAAAAWQSFSLCRAAGQQPQPVSNLVPWRPLAASEPQQPQLQQQVLPPPAAVEPLQAAAGAAIASAAAAAAGGVSAAPDDGAAAATLLRRQQLARAISGSASSAVSPAQQRRSVQHLQQHQHLQGLMQAPPPQQMQQQQQQQPYLQQVQWQQQQQHYHNNNLQQQQQQRPPFLFDWGGDDELALDNPYASPDSTSVPLLAGRGAGSSGGQLATPLQANGPAAVGRDSRQQELGPQHTQHVPGSLAYVPDHLRTYQHDRGAMGDEWQQHSRHRSLSPDRGRSSASLARYRRSRSRSPLAARTLRRSLSPEQQGRRQHRRSRSHSSSPAVRGRMRHLVSPQRGHSPTRDPESPRAGSMHRKRALSYEEREAGRSKHGRFEEDNEEEQLGGRFRGQQQWGRDGRQREVSGARPDTAAVEQLRQRWLRKLAVLLGSPGQPPPSITLAELPRMLAVPERLISAYGTLKRFLMAAPELCVNMFGGRSDMRSWEIQLVPQHHRALLAAAKEQGFEPEARAPAPPPAASSADIEALVERWLQQLAVLLRDRGSTTIDISTLRDIHPIPLDVLLHFSTEQDFCQATKGLDYVEGPPPRLHLPPLTQRRLIEAAGAGGYGGGSRPHAAAGGHGGGGGGGGGDRTEAAEGHRASTTHHPTAQQPARDDSINGLEKAWLQQLAVLLAPAPGPGEEARSISCNELLKVLPVDSRLAEHYGGTAAAGGDGEGGSLPALRFLACMPQLKWTDEQQSAICLRPGAHENLLCAAEEASAAAAAAGNAAAAKQAAQGRPAAAQHAGDDRDGAIGRVVHSWMQQLAVLLHERQAGNSITFKELKSIHPIPSLVFTGAFHRRYTTAKAFVEDTPGLRLNDSRPHGLSLQPAVQRRLLQEVADARRAAGGAGSGGAGAMGPAEFERAQPPPPPVRQQHERVQQQDRRIQEQQEEDDEWWGAQHQPPPEHVAAAATAEHAAGETATDTAPVDAVAKIAVATATGSPTVSASKVAETDSHADQPEGEQRGSGAAASRHIPEETAACPSAAARHIKQHDMEAAAEPVSNSKATDMDTAGDKQGAVVDGSKASSSSRRREDKGGSSGRKVSSRSDKHAKNSSDSRHAEGDKQGDGDKSAQRVRSSSSKQDGKKDKQDSSNKQQQDGKGRRDSSSKSKRAEQEEQVTDRSRGKEKGKDRDKGRKADRQPIPSPAAAAAAAAAAAVEVSTPPGSPKGGGSSKKRHGSRSRENKDLLETPRSSKRRAELAAVAEAAAAAAAAAGGGDGGGYATTRRYEGGRQVDRYGDMMQVGGGWEGGYYKAGGYNSSMMMANPHAGGPYHSQHGARYEEPAAGMYAAGGARVMHPPPPRRPYSAGYWGSPQGAAPGFDNSLRFSGQPPPPPPPAAAAGGEYDAGHYDYQGGGFCGRATQPGSHWGNAAGGGGGYRW